LQPSVGCDDRLRESMAEDARDNSRSGRLRELAVRGGRAANSSLRPLTAAMGASFETTLRLEKRAVVFIFESAGLDGVLSATLDSSRFQTAFARALEGEGARRAVDSFFESRVFDQVVDRLLASDALWRLVDEVAGSPAVTAAISEQGLGFADQVGDEVRARSRTADDWLERAARRLSRRHPGVLPAEADASVQ
jgi:hypothetical protein